MRILHECEHRNRSIAPLASLLAVETAQLSCFVWAYPCSAVAGWAIGAAVAGTGFSISSGM